VRARVLRGGRTPGPPSTTLTGDHGCVASRYDDELWELVPAEPGSPPDHVRHFVRALGQATRALDLGCGDGRLTMDLDAEYVVAADPSVVALDRARTRLPAPRVEFAEIEPDAELPFADGSFDLVLCAETIEHVRDVQLLLSEARRVLRPRGRLGVTTPAHGRRTALDALVRGFERRFDPLSPHLRFFTRRSLSCLLDDLGFALESVEREGGSLLARALR
jgi:SAM-dependent methyltransferase